MKKGILIVSLLIAAIFLSSSGDCDGSVDPYDEENLGVQEINWLDDETLEVKAYVTINCAEDIHDGDYEIWWNEITLWHSYIECTLCAECLCAHELTYKFSGLNKGDYEFELEGLGIVSCAEEGEFTSGAVAQGYYRGCCGGLETFEARAGLEGGGLLCHDPTKGNPSCKHIGTKSEGWYYSGTDELIIYGQCANICGDGICDIEETPENCPQDC